MSACACSGCPHPQYNCRCKCPVCKKEAENQLDLFTEHQRNAVDWGEQKPELPPITDGKPKC